MTPGTTDSMSVTVAVPAAAPLGDYTVTLTASNGSPATKRSNTATITVADQVAPSIRISTPQNGSRFTFGQAIAADYGCSDQTNASGVQSCSGPVANGARIDTGSLGRKLFTVNSSDNAGNSGGGDEHVHDQAAARARRHDAVHLHPLHPQDRAELPPGQGHPEGLDADGAVQGQALPGAQALPSGQRQEERHPEDASSRRPTRPAP